MNEITHRTDLLLTVSFARKLAQLAAGLDDERICDEAGLLELLALADRAEEALSVLHPDCQDTE